MENPPLPTLSPLVAAFFSLAVIVSNAITGLLTHLFTRRQNLTRSDALNYKTGAQAREIDSRIIAEAHEQLAEFADQNTNLKIQHTWDEQEIANLQWELSLAQGREKVLNQQVELAHAELLVLRTPRTQLPPIVPLVE